MGLRFFSEDEYEELLIEREEFVAIACRWFVVEDVDRQRIDDLFAAWEAFVADEAQVAGHDDLFKRENADRLAGVAWWEELVWRSDPDILDINPEARVCMFLSTVPHHAPLPRLYCPQQLVGAWSCIASGDRYGELSPPAAARQMVLGANGALQDETAPAGARWCVHLEGWKPRQAMVNLFLIPPDGRTPLTRILLKIDHDAIETEVADLKYRVERWRRAS